MTVEILSDAAGVSESTVVRAVELGYDGYPGLERPCRWCCGKDWILPKHKNAEKAEQGK